MRSGRSPRAVATLGTRHPCARRASTLDRPIVLRWSRRSAGFGLVSRDHRARRARTPRATLLRGAGRVGATASLDAGSKAESHLVGHHRDRPRPTAPRSMSPASRTSGRTPSPSSPARPCWAETPRSTGPSPASARSCTQPHRQPARRPGLDRQPGGDRLRRRQAAVRPHQLHAPHRRGHDRRPAQQGRVHRARPAATSRASSTSRAAPRARTRSSASSACCWPSTARSVTIPSLEIDQPDVRRAMHSSSVGPIDESQVFYLMSRGPVTRGGAQGHRARLPGAGRGAHPAARGAGAAAGLLERKWPAGAAARA